MSKKMLCVVAGQRSGSTALRSAFNATGRFENFAEIFQTIDEHPSRFLNYAQQENIAIADMATLEGCKNIASSYMEHLFDLAQPKFPLVDVKLNSWNVLRPFWQYPHEAPLAIDIFRQRGCFFVFLTREDLLGQILSEQVARKVGKWHRLDIEGIDEQITLNPGLIASKARLILQAEHLLWSFLKRDRNRVIPIVYESVFTDEGVDWSQLKAVSNYFELADVERVKPKISKNTGDYKTIITNHDEIKYAVETVVSEYGRVET